MGSIRPSVPGRVDCHLCDAGIMAGMASRRGLTPPNPSSESRQTKPVSTCMLDAESRRSRKASEMAVLIFKTSLMMLEVSSLLYSVQP